MNSKNMVPYLGMAPYTPMYLYIRKSKTEPTQIEEIRTVKSSPAKEGFLKELADVAELGEGFTSKIRFDRMAQMQKQKNLENLEDGFDIDFDLEIIRLQEKEQAAGNK